MFQIVTTTYNNLGWLQLLLNSLHKTLWNRERLIIVADSSDIDHINELRDINCFGLNISFVRVDAISGSGWPPYIEAVSKAVSHRVCHIDADVIMLQKYWDLYMESMLRDRYTLVAAASRYIDIAELYFCLTDIPTLISSGARHASELNWNEQVMPLPKIGEHAAITYYDCLRGGRPKLFTKESMRNASTRWGTVLLNDDEEEILYHNYYSSRILHDNIPVIEAQTNIHHIAHVYDNIPLIAHYLNNIWPASIVPYLVENDWRSWDSQLEPSEIQDARVRKWYEEKIRTFNLSAGMKKDSDEDAS